jgi:Xaa-Pro aminopeptidase
VSVERQAAEVLRRIDLVRRAAADMGAGGALLRARRNFSWLTAGGVNHVVLSTELGAAPVLVTPDRCVVLAPVNEAARIRDEELAGLPIEIDEIAWYGSPTGPHHGERLAGDEDLEVQLIARRMHLADFERERLARLAAGVVAAVEGVLASAAQGDSELALTGRLAERLSGEGIRLPVVLAAADERIDRYRHPLPTDARVARRIMLVAVGERWGLHAAVTRIRELEPPDDALGERIAAVHEVLAAMHAATRSGSTLGAVFAAAQRAYAAAGFRDEWRLHHQGGILGYQPRERIAIPNDPTQIESGMAFAWNPSVRGAKAEESALLDERRGLVLLTRPEADLAGAELA